MHSFAKEAIKIAGYKCPADRVTSDIVDITCLIIEEGGECRFIHKSLQEYHAACFIESQPDETVVKFYGAMTEKWYSWEQELEFLSMIDKYRFLRCFAIPDMLKLTEICIGKTNDLWKNSEEILLLFGPIYLVFNSFKEFTPEKRRTICYRSKLWCLRTYNNYYMNRILRLDLTSGPKKHKNKVLSYVTDVSDAEEFIHARYRISIPKLISEGIVEYKDKEFIESIVKKIQKELVTAQGYVKHVESTKSVFDF